jgi:hypothetical protein
LEITKIEIVSRIEANFGNQPGDSFNTTTSSSDLIALPRVQNNVNSLSRKECDSAQRVDRADQASALRLCVAGAWPWVAAPCPDELSAQTSMSAIVISKVMLRGA